MQKHRECCEFVRTLRVKAIPEEDKAYIFNYDLIKEANQECTDLVDSKSWELANNSRAEEPLLPKRFTSAVNKKITAAF